MSQTTIPITTRMAAGASGATTATGPSSCQVNIPDYTVLRQQNIAKINDYYKTLLDSYTKSYTDYTTQRTGNLVDKQNAEAILKPKVVNYNTQVINVSQAMINSVNQDTDLIAEQNSELESKTEKIDTIMANIKILKDRDTELDVLTGSRNDSLSSTKTGVEDMQFNTYVYIGICVLLVLIIIGLIIYLVYSSYSSSSKNNTTSSNASKNTTTNNTTKNNTKTNI